MELLFLLNLFAVSCPTDCATFALPAVEDLDIDCLPPTVKSSITHIIIGNPDEVTAPLPVDWTSPVEWAAVIDNADATGAKFKRIPVRGSIGESERETRERAGNRTTTTNRAYTLEATIDTLPDGIFDQGRLLECGNTNVRLWFETDARIFGGPNGIITKDIDSQFPHGIENTDVELNILRFTWDARTFPDRANNPF